MVEHYVLFSVLYQLRLLSLYLEHLDGMYTVPYFFDNDEDISLAFGNRLRLHTRFMVFSHRGGGAGFHKDAFDQYFGTFVSPVEKSGSFFLLI